LARLALDIAGGVRVASVEDVLIQVVHKGQSGEGDPPVPATEREHKDTQAEQSHPLRCFVINHGKWSFDKGDDMLKYSVAIAALLISAPVAFAQGAGEARHGSEGPGASMSRSDASGSNLKSGSGPQDNSGASSGASSGSSGSSSSASDDGLGQNKGSGSAKSEGSARDNASGHVKDRPDKMDKRSEGKANSRDADRNADRGGRKSAPNAQNDNGRDHNERNANADRDRSNDAAHAKDHNGASTGASEGTAGRSGGRGSVASVTTDQKTRIGSVFTRHHVEPARNLNVVVNVGVRLPRSAHFYPVPEDVIAIVPEYRDYEYIMLDDNRIAIIDPDTLEVVDIIVLA
jgi:hypothetical protein